MASKQTSMNFAQKLIALTEDRIKSKVDKRAGLPSGAISTYIARGYCPRADNALRLARALGVSVEWLIDDEQGMPPVLAKAA